MPACHDCAIEMREGIALAQTYVGGPPDFPGDTHAITVSAGGPGRLVRCWKCPLCGLSVTVDAPAGDGEE